MAIQISPKIVDWAHRTASSYQLAAELKQLFDACAQEAATPATADAAKETADAEQAADVEMEAADAEQAADVEMEAADATQEQSAAAWEKKMLKTTLRS